MYTYIVIDDEMLTRKGTIKKLEDMSSEISCCCEAENGVEALEKIKTHNPDIIITDMNMPFMDGTKLLSILSEEYPEKQIIVISSYKDFEYIHQAIKANAIDYILKPFRKEELQKTVKKAIEHLESEDMGSRQTISSDIAKEESLLDYDKQLLHSLLFGYQSSDINLISKKLAKIASTHDYVLFNIHSSKAITEASVNNFLNENGFGDLAVFFKSKRSNNVGFLILFVGKSSSLNIKTFCSQIANSFVYQFNFDHPFLCFGISELYDSLHNLNDAYHETISALNMRKLSENNSCFFFEDRPKQYPKYNWSKKEELLFNIEMGNTENVRKLIESMFEDYVADDLYVHRVKHIFLQLLNESQSFLTDFDDESQGEASLNVENTLNNLFSLEELKDYYMSFFSNISETAKENSNTNNYNIVDKLCVYIKKNYRKNLSLEILSSMLYMNRSYLSQCFKKQTGETFVDYVNNVRIENAKTLLKGSEKKAYQIAKSVGYSNSKYFFRVFKKKTGMTPEQYKESC